MHTIWKTIKKGQYLYALIPNHPNATKNGYVLEHRAVMEQKLKRYLTAEEVVHHINKDKHDNSENNLQVMSVSEHASLHNKTGRTYVDLICPVCQNPFQREIRNIGKSDSPTCSRKCNGIRSQKIQQQRRLKCGE